MKVYWRYICLLWLLLSLPLQSMTQVRVPKARSSTDISFDYYQGLLQRALELGAKGRAVPAIVQTAEMEQGRAVRELSLNRSLDVIWLGADSRHAPRLQAVPIPLERGLIGFRILLVHQQRLPALDEVQQLDHLKKLYGCQGLGWPDTDVLQNAGLKILTSPGFENLFKQVQAKRCDYFPRGLFEAATELRERQARYPDLREYSDLMLHYPLAIYFYTRTEDTVLQQWLTDGLEQMIDSGELLKYMQQHPLTRHVFPLRQFKPSRWFEFVNPSLPDAALHNQRYWFSRDDFR